ncbi:crossover junction endodeoxyribonuclease RuvC [Croceimicrobium hydrocarbonivorans]|nr:crossover junction endodeoxyribonuclease RuvC [Croceimicrobium hydrocarbonivorans]
MSKEKIILGIDPGTQIMGYGIIEVQGKSFKMIDLGSIKFKLADTPILRLKQIFESSSEIIEKFLPDEMAVEAPFFGKNVQSMLKLGRAQGVVMAAALSKNIPVEEYSPRKIKQSITGKGSASKEQVYAMLERSFGHKIETRYLDASDALAVALCHHYQASNPVLGGTKAKNWEQFLRANPDRKA